MAADGIRSAPSLPVTCDASNVDEHSVCQSSRLVKTPSPVRFRMAFDDQSANFRHQVADESGADVCFEWRLGYVDVCPFKTRLVFFVVAAVSKIDAAGQHGTHPLGNHLIS